MLKSAFSSPKIRTLAARLGIPFPHAVGICGMLWHFTADHAPQGNVGKHSDFEIAIAVEWPGDPSALVAALVACRLLDSHPEHRLLVHDWAEHCPRYVHAILARKGLDIIGRKPTVVATVVATAVPTVVATSSSSSSSSTSTSTSTSSSPSTSSQCRLDDTTTCTHDADPEEEEEDQTTKKRPAGAGKDQIDMQTLARTLETELAACSRKRLVVEKVIPKCNPKTRKELLDIVISWPRGEWIWDAYQRWKAGAAKARKPAAYWATCIRSAMQRRETARGYGDGVP